MRLILLSTAVLACLVAGAMVGVFVLARHDATTSVQQALLANAVHGTRAEDFHQVEVTALPRP